MRIRSLLALLLGFGLAAAACSSSNDTSDETALEDDASTITTQVDRDLTDTESEADETTTTTEAPEPEPDPVAGVVPDVVATVDGSDITLTWANVDGLRWEVQRDGRVLDTHREPSFVDTGLEDGAYRYQVIAIGTDDSRLASDVVIVQVGPVDELAPPAPTNVELTTSGDAIVITWNPPADLDDVRGYLVHRDRVFIAYVDDATEYVDTDVEPGRAYNYRIRSQDDAGNVSEPEAALVDGVAADLTPPTTPTGAAIAVDGDEIVITWDEASDNEGIWGYLIHRDGEFVLWTGLDTEFREPAPTDGSTPTYVVRAQDFTGNYSEPTAGLSLAG